MEEKKSSGLKTLLWVAAAVAAVAFLPGIIGAAAAGTGLGALPLVGGAIQTAATWLGGHTMIAGIAKAAVTWGVPLFAAAKAWGSHKQNQAIDAENAAMAQQGAATGLSPQQQRAIAISQMQDEDQGQSSAWRQRIEAQRAYSQNVR